jgi:MFS family permease
LEGFDSDCCVLYLDKLDNTPIIDVKCCVDRDMTSRRTNSGISVNPHAPLPTTGSLAIENCHCLTRTPSSSSLDMPSHAETRIQDDSEHERSSDPTTRRPSCFVIQVTFIASLGGILFGYDLGIISCALPQMTTTFSLSSQQQELIVSILYLGGAIGATVGGSICDLFGRKKSILLCDIIFCVGAAILYAAPTVSTIVFGRIIVGFAIALSGIADVTYLHEIAPIQFRGAIVSVNEACISLGFLLAFTIGSIPSLSNQAATENSSSMEGWRIMFGVSGIVAVFQFLGMIYMPESPKWLTERGLHEESTIAQRQIQSHQLLYQLPPSSSSSDRAGRESATDIVHTSNYQSISSPVNHYGPTDPSDSTEPDFATISTSANGKYWRTTTGSCVFVRICWAPFRQLAFLSHQFFVFLCTTMAQYPRQVYITLFLATTQMLCGQTNVLSYAPLIFAAISSGSSEAEQGWATLSIGIMKFLVTVIVIWKIESIGRRTLLLGGIGTIAIGLFLLAIAFAGAKVVSTEIDGAADETQVKNANNGFYLALPGVLLVVCGYSMSYGPLTWLITSELFPTNIRGRALGMSTIVTYTCAAFVTYTFLSVSALVGSSAVFSIYLFITSIGLIFALLAIPDTGGRTSQQIDHDLDAMIWWQQRPYGKIGPVKSVHTSLSSSERDAEHFSETVIT